MPKSKKLTRPQLHGKIRSLEADKEANLRTFIEEQNKLHRLMGRAARLEWIVHATIEVVGTYIGGGYGIALLQHGLKDALRSVDEDYPGECEQGTAMCATSSLDQEPMKGAPPA